MPLQGLTTNPPRKHSLRSSRRTLIVNRPTRSLALTLLLASFTISNAFGNGWADQYVDLREEGYLFQGSITQAFQGVVGGGSDEVADNLKYGGHGDYSLLLDGERLGCQEGSFIRMRAEHRFGSATDPANTGSPFPTALPVNLPAGEDSLYLTNLVFGQALSENFAVFMGKFDTLDGDRNDFAHGRGVTQFSNLALAVNPIGIVAVPYASLGAGFVVLQDFEPVFVFSVMNATDTTRTTGFDELFENGAVISTGLRLPTNFAGKLGHQSFTAIYSTRNYDVLESDPRVNAEIVGGGVRLTDPKEGTYALLYNFDQYLVQDRAGHGWGVFGRAGLGDQEVNPLEYFLSVGIGGNNMLVKGRRHDTFGVGYYYLGATDDSQLLADIESTVGFDLEDGQGVECYYNAAIGDFTSLTIDYQFIDSPADVSVFENGTSILGLRWNIWL